MRPLGWLVGVQMGCCLFVVNLKLGLFLWFEFENANDCWRLTRFLLAYESSVRWNLSGCVFCLRSGVTNNGTYPTLY